MHIYFFKWFLFTFVIIYLNFEVITYAIRYLIDYNKINYKKNIITYISNIITAKLVKYQIY